MRCSSVGCETEDDVNEDEPMAMVCYDFPSKHCPDVKISGKTNIHTRSQAQKIVETLNAEYGEGSHWVEVLNWTYNEWIANQ